MTEVVAALIWQGEIPNYDFCPADVGIFVKICEVYE